MIDITDAPFAAGTPEHDHWVRTVFIPGVGRGRWEADRAKYGAQSIGANLTFTLDTDDEPELWPRDNPFLSVADIDKMTTGAKRLGGALQDLHDAFWRLFGFSEEEIKRSRDRQRRDEQAKAWYHIPQHMWVHLDDRTRASLGKVCVWKGGPFGSADYYDHGVFLPEYGPPKPQNRAARRTRALPPLRPRPLCPIHGKYADNCGPCQRRRP